MTEHDTSRRPSLTRWLTDKVEGLTGSRRANAPTAPDPQLQARAAEIARLEADRARLAKELDDAQVMLMGKEAEFRNELQELQERNAELLDKIVKLTQRDRELQAKVIDAKFDGTGARDQVKKLDSDLRDLRRSHQAKEQQIAALQQKLTTLEQEAAERPDPAEAAAGADSLAGRLQEALAQTQALTAERDGLTARLAEARAALTAPKERGASPPDEEPGPYDADGRALARSRGRVATGTASQPLKALAAGKRPAVARQISAARERRGAAAEALLASGDRGFATLPAGFVEALLDARRSRRATGEQRAAHRGNQRSHKVRRNRSRRSSSDR